MCLNISKSSMYSFSTSVVTELNSSYPRSHLCGFDLNLTYPQHGHFPTLNGIAGPLPSNSSQRALKKSILKSALKTDDRMKRTNMNARNLELDIARMQKRDQWKRDLRGRANGTIDPWYGCDIYDEMIDYALNFSLPWSAYFSRFGPSWCTYI